MKPQLALHLYKDLEKVKPKSEGHTYVVLEKYDGWYGYFDIGGNLGICSRKNREIPSLVKYSGLLKTLTQSLPTGRLVFEILVAGKSDFHVMNGILNRKEPAASVYFKVHDFIADNTQEFYDRYNIAQEIVRELNLHTGFLFSMVPIIAITSDQNYWRVLVEEKWEEGREGIILKRMDAPYSAGKRNADLLKIKEEVTLDLLVVNIIGGEGKYKNTTGALLVRDSKGNTHTVSGMTDAQRTLWWAAPSEIVGSVVEIKAMKILKDNSLREPRFKAIRYDKGVEDID